MKKNKSQNELKLLLHRINTLNAFIARHKMLIVIMISYTEWNEKI
jgi:hypothetical protein